MQLESATCGRYPWNSTKQPSKVTSLGAKLVVQWTILDGSNWKARRRRVRSKEPLPEAGPGEKKKFDVNK
jgi:hypothetical protein